jgi:hypothetical protein
VVARGPLRGRAFLADIDFACACPKMGPSQAVPHPVDWVAQVLVFTHEHHLRRDEPMSYAFASPIPPGKTDAVRALIAETLGPRKAELDDLQRRSGITEESYWLQHDPEGDIMVVVTDNNRAGFWAIMANPRRTSTAGTGSRSRPSGSSMRVRRVLPTMSSSAPGRRPGKRSPVPAIRNPGAVSHS